MTEWLLQKDDYNPPRDRDSFINKSILSILKVFSKLGLQSDSCTPRVGLNPAFKMISTMLMILLTSLSRRFLFILIVDTYLILAVGLLSANQIKHILRMGLFSALFSLFILAPSIIMGNINNSIIIVLKVFTMVTALNITIVTTCWEDITGSLGAMHIPNIFVLVLDITMKYILILGEFSLNMLYSLKLKSIGKSNKKSTSLSGIMGTMFIKSKDMAEEMYDAMECRGFTGEYRVKKEYNISFIDVLFAIINIVIGFLYIYFDRL